MMDKASYYVPAMLCFTGAIAAILLGREGWQWLLVVGLLIFPLSRKEGEQ